MHSMLIWLLLDGGVCYRGMILWGARPGRSCRESSELRFERGRGRGPEIARTRKGNNENGRSDDADVLAAALASARRR